MIIQCESEESHLKHNFLRKNLNVELGFGVNEWSKRDRGEKKTKDKELI